MALVLSIKQNMEVHLEHPDGTRVVIRFRRTTKGVHTRLQALIDAPREVRVHRGQDTEPRLTGPNTIER